MAKNNPAKVISFIIREFYELKKLLILINRIEKERTTELVSVLKKEIKHLLRKLRSGIFASEERIVYRLSSQYEKLRDAYYENSSKELELSQREGINELLKEGNIQYEQLVKLGARGGDIEKALYKAKNDPNESNIKNVKELIEDAIQADQSLETVIKKLVLKFEKISSLKRHINPALNYSDLAIAVINLSRGTVETKQNCAIILFVKSIYDEVMEKFWRRQFLTYHNLDTPHEYLKRLEKEYKNISEDGKKKDLLELDTFFSYSKDEGFYKRKEKSLDEKKYTYAGVSLITMRGVSLEHELDSLEYKLLESGAIVGYAELKSAGYKDQYLNALMIFRIAAKSGFGPYFFELVFAYAAKKQHPIIIDVKEVSPAARKVLQYFDTNRRDVIKYPAALSKYPELIGYSKKGANKLFGSGCFSSVFGEYGYPIDTPHEKILESFTNRISNVESIVKQFGSIEKALQYHYMNSRTYIKREGTKKTNLAIGGLASLDKAYYYDGKIKELNKLIINGKIKELGCGNKDVLSRPGQLLNAGLNFFFDSKKRGGF